jgi:hypothetical protein
MQLRCPVSVLVETPRRFPINLFRSTWYCRSVRLSERLMHNPRLEAMQMIIRWNHLLTNPLPSVSQYRTSKRIVPSRDEVYLRFFILAMAKISPVSAAKVPGQSPTWCRRIFYLPPRSTHFPPVKRMQMTMHRKRQSTNVIPPIPKVPTLHLRLRFRPENGRCCNELILVYIPHRSPPSQSKINRHRRTVGQQK